MTMTGSFPIPLKYKPFAFTQFILSRTAAHPSGREAIDHRVWQWHPVGLAWFTYNGAGGFTFGTTVKETEGEGRG